MQLFEQKNVLPEFFLVFGDAKIFYPEFFFISKLLCKSFFILSSFVLDEKKILQIFILKLPCQIFSDQNFSLSLKIFFEKCLAENDKINTKKGNIQHCLRIDCTDANYRATVN